MKKILVCGVVNIENNLKVEAFPIPYNSVNFSFFGINTNVAGVGYNLSKSLTTLGSEVCFLAAIGDDLNGDAIISTLEKSGISTKCIQKIAKNTPQSIILYDEMGKRQIFTDLKNLPDIDFPEDVFEKEYKECEILVITNINFSRKFLTKAKSAGKQIACDVQAISDLNNEYNQDYMRNADILFFSNDNLGESAENFMKQLVEKFDNKLIVAGCGSKGALIYVKADNIITKYDSFKTREVVNTVGAGDTLFSTFIHFYSKQQNPYIALQKAMLHASYKIGESGASNGFINEEQIEELYKKHVLYS